MQEKNFVLMVENYNSPIIITVPHGGMGRRQSSWLDFLFERREKPKNKKNISKESVILGGDIGIMYIVADILKKYKANAVIGLLPRLFVDYNRFTKKVAYSDKGMKLFYDEYHKSIDKIIKKLLVKHKNAILFDFHGFDGSSPKRKLDIILSTNKQSSPNNIDRLLYSKLSEKYKIFCAGISGSPREKEIFVGDTTNFHYYKKYGIDALLVEISSRFRSLEFSSKERKEGKILSNDFAKFFKMLQKKK